MEKELLKPLIKIITLIPGIVGLSSIDISKSNKPLKEENYKDGFIFEKISGKVDISMALIVYDEIPMKIIADEIFSSMQDLLKKKNEKLGKVNIYVRGIK